MNKYVLRLTLMHDWLFLDLRNYDDYQEIQISKIQFHWITDMHKFREYVKLKCEYYSNFIKAPLNLIALVIIMRGDCQKKLRDPWRSQKTFEEFFFWNKLILLCHQAIKLSLCDKNKHTRTIEIFFLAFLTIFFCTCAKS